MKRIKLNYTVECVEFVEEEDIDWEVFEEEKNNGFENTKQDLAEAIMEVLIGDGNSCELHDLIVEIVE